MSDNNQGEKRSGAGRKKGNAHPRCVCLTDAQCKLLRMWGRGSLSAGLRWLIDQAALVVVRADPPKIESE